MSRAVVGGGHRIGAQDLDEVQRRPEEFRGLRLMLASICCQKGDWEGNLARHREILRQASDAQCQIAVFPEMSLTGSVDPRADPQDLIGLDSRAVRLLVEATQEYSVAAAFGISERADNGASHISQIYASHGQLLGVYRKRHLGEGEEAYTPGAQSEIFRFGALRFGIAICADGEVDHPFDEPAADGAELIFFCAAPGLTGRRTDEDGWRVGHEWWVKHGLGEATRHASRNGIWVALVTQAGSTVDEDFPGLAALISPTGEVIARLDDWAEGTLVTEVPLRVEVEPVREASRVLVMDQSGDVLLVKFSSDSGHSWWVAPGGGLEGTEDHLGAARRELQEELGRDDIEIGPEIGRRTHTLSFNNGPWMTQHEVWFMARSARFEVLGEVVSKLAAEYVTEVRWWSAEELRRVGVVTAPRRLSDLVARVRSGRIPTPDTDLGV
jgi:predicted amidohydrolase